MGTEFKLDDHLLRAGEAEWRGEVEKALKGADFDKTLTSRTYDDITIQPLYDKSAIDAVKAAGHVGKAPFIRGYGPNPFASNGSHSTNPWQIIQLLDLPSLSHANEILEEEIAGGVNGVMLQTGNGVAYGGNGLPLLTAKDYHILFEDIDLSQLQIYYAASYDSLPQAALLTNYCNEKEIPVESISGSFGFDPIAFYAATHSFPEPFPEILNGWVDAAKNISDRGFAMTPFMASSRVWHQMGASTASELALVLSSALSYWRALENQGMDVSKALDLIDLNLSSERDIFVGIAKFRAMRALWARLQEGAGVESKPVRIFAEQSYRHFSSRDAQVNMLRAAAATFSAGIGGAEGVLLMPYSCAHGVADSTARRQTRNIQVIAQEESHLGRVSDCAGGSYYIESLTQQLAAKAWSIFRTIEADGGLLKALLNGRVKRLMRDSIDRQEEDIALGRHVITGVNSFPELNEDQPPLMDLPDQDQDLIHEDELPDRPILPAPGDGARFAGLVQMSREGASVQYMEVSLMQPRASINVLPEREMRAASGFEAFRDLSDEAKKQFGTRPPVFVANLGKPSDYTARATWVKSFFESGGLRADLCEGINEAEAIGEAFAASGAPLACICSSDAQYEELGRDVALALQEAGAMNIYLVTRPNFLTKIPHEDRALYNCLLYQGCNMLAILAEAYQLIGIEELFDPDNDESLMV